MSTHTASPTQSHEPILTVPLPPHPPPWLAAVRVYNELDPDTKAFNSGWDALNRFVSYFKVPNSDASELRRYYVERAEEARAKSRKVRGSLRRMAWW